MKKIGLYRIRQTQNDNAYVVQLPSNLDISLIFNVSDMYEFHGDVGDIEVLEVSK